MLIFHRQDSIPQNDRLTSSWKSDVYDGHWACRTTSWILLRAASRTEVRAIRCRTLSSSLPHLN